MRKKKLPPVTKVVRGRKQDNPALPRNLLNVLDAFGDLIKEHDDCEWEQIGRCVYCHRHKVRLFQGTIGNHKKFNRQQAQYPKSDEMRRRFGK